MSESKYDGRYPEPPYETPADAAQDAPTAEPEAEQYIPTPQDMAIDLKWLYETYGGDYAACAIRRAIHAERQLVTLTEERRKDREALMMAYKDAYECRCHTCQAARARLEAK